MEHKWKFGTDDAESCQREGCFVRRYTKNDVWQRKRGAHWRSITREPIPPCEAPNVLEAPTKRSPILDAEWEVDEDGYVAPRGGGAPLDISQGDHIAQAWAASPDVIRELLDVHHLGVGLGQERRARIRTALLKAGVSEEELRGGGA